MPHTEHSKISLAGGCDVDMVQVSVERWPPAESRPCSTVATPEATPLEQILAAITAGLTPIKYQVQQRPDASVETLRALNRLLLTMEAAIRPLRRDIEVQRMVLDRQRAAVRRRNEAVVPSFVCPTCHWTSYGLHDIAQRYCVSCHRFAPPA